MSTGTKTLNKYHVTVAVDSDSERDYIVEAETSDVALNIGIEYVRDLVNGTVDGLDPEDDDADWMDGTISYGDLGPEAKKIVDAVKEGS